VTVQEALVGIDLGTTMSKVLVRTPTGEQLALVEAHTPWTTTAGGGTETSAERFVDLAVNLLCSGYERASADVPLRVSSIAIAGLAESGVLLDGSGRPQTPVIAWFDSRGGRQIEAISLRNNGFGAEFVRRTGLPWDCQSSVAKLLWFVDHGLELRPAHRWLSIPEYVVHRLGGELVHEPSLASRTGLLDQATGAAWTDGAVELGLPPTLLPDRQPYGEIVGVLGHAGLPEGLQGAALVVGGHDHPVAAIGVGATRPDELLNSTGTADVVVRSLPGVTTDEQRERLVGQGISVGMHVLPGTTAVIGGVRGGLLLRRVLGLLGVTTAAQRDALDRAALAVGPLPAGLDISGAGPTGDDVILRMRDDADPATTWAAATRYTARETRVLLDLIESVVGPHTRAVASGGWTRMASVRTAKSAVIEHLTFSDLPEPVVVGAALLAQRAATTGPV
jgi:sugar (pentulose or hexulose) kinase